MTNRVIGSQTRAAWRWVPVPTGPTVIIDASLGFHFAVPVTEATSLEPPQNGTNGQPVRIRFTQDGTGGHAVTLNGSVVGTVSVSTAANAITYIDMICGETGTWEALPPASGISQGAADLLYQALGTITESGDSPPPETFFIGQIADGEYLKRSGTSIISAAIVVTVGESRAPTSDVTLAADASLVVPSYYQLTEPRLITMTEPSELLILG